MDVADHCAEFWFLYPGSAVGGHDTHDRDANDSQDLRLCLDSTHWIFCYEAGMQVREEQPENNGRPTGLPLSFITYNYAFS